eukprot:scaffold74030_cov29-Prasinocladus_malaysianus.AAC.1
MSTNTSTRNMNDSAATTKSEVILMFACPVFVVVPILFQSSVSYGYRYGTSQGTSGLSLREPHFGAGPSRNQVAIDASRLVEQDPVGTKDAMSFSAAQLPRSAVRVLVQRPPLAAQRSATTTPIPATDRPRALPFLPLNFSRGCTSARLPWAARFTGMPLTYTG